MKTIFKGIVGSQAYGTSLPTSDIDYKSVHLQPLSEVVGFKYKEQIDRSKDDTSYEVKRFLELAKSANPTMLEMLFLPSECLIVVGEKFRPILENRHKFLTKRCRDSFGGYAVQQIQKAKGLNKKMNWEKVKVDRKTPLDFCFVHDKGKSVPVLKWLKEQNKRQQYCGLVALDRMSDCYALYYDNSQQYLDELGKGARTVTGHGYKGIVGEDSNDIRLSSVPKYTLPEAVMYFGKTQYSQHCKDYREYQEWLNTRNESRYVDTVVHGQMIDGKNLLHCRRLIDMAIEIATEGTLNVLRPNANYLLQIRRGEIPLEGIIEKAEEDIIRLDSLYKECSLPEEIDNDWIHDLLVKIRLNGL